VPSGLQASRAPHPGAAGIALIAARDAATRSGQRWSDGPASFSRHTFKSGKARIPEDVAAALTPAQWQAFTRSIKSK